VHDGILLVDKPPSITSAGVVRAVKRRYRVGSVGHLGTLDPMATGLLPLCLGNATKIAQFLAVERKAYSGTIRLGLLTDTLDVTGEVVERGVVPPLDAALLDEVARRFVGAREQRPPMYSAVKQGGTALYKLARAGIEVEREARQIHIERLALTPSVDPTEVGFSIACSKGTYVRVLAQEIGAALGTVASLASLHRTEFGEFTVAEAHSLADLIADGRVELPLIAARQALRGFREIEVDRGLARAIATGKVAALARFAAPIGNERFASVIAPNGGLLAVLEADRGAWRLRRVLMPEAAELYRP
jgi:tRNA pseudouridine55 synthase